MAEPSVSSSFQDQVTSLQYVTLETRQPSRALRALKFEESKLGTLNVDRRKLGGIAFCVICQCIAVYVGAYSVLKCIWSPDKFTSQNMQIIMVMYLYDYKKCGFKLKSAKGIQTVLLNRMYNQTSANVKPIFWTPLVKSTSTRLTQTTRKYMEISIAFHAIWMFAAILAWFCVQVIRLKYKYLKLVITVFMYSIVLMVVFDVSMAIVYIAHIQQCLTKSMILRYAGWAVVLNIQDPEEFGGWIPMVASVCWMRGIFFLIVNILSVRSIWFIRKKIKKKEVIVKHAHKRNAPIPESDFAIHAIDHEKNEKVLVYHR